MKQKKRILVSPLNWGLGHATRCIPIINKLLNENFEVFIASEGRSLNLLKEEFPEIQFIQLNGVSITYHKTLPMSISIIIQIPKIVLSIYREHRSLKKIIKKYNLDGVISDNRFGLWNNNIPCAFITHQLKIKSPIFENLIQRVNYYFINKFSECWIIDSVEKNLAGELSLPIKMPKRYKYIGTQSRFNFSIRKKEYKFLAILSGPEPQRTELEKIIIQELVNRNEKSLIILGKTEQKSITNVRNCTIISSANSKEINRYILKSEIILCRSGYSTIMDLSKLGAKAIFIPTPGQTEQEYLAKIFHERGMCFYTSQKNFNLDKSIKESYRYCGLKSYKNKAVEKKLFCLFQNKRKC